MNKRMMLLVNPNAGKGGYKTVLGGVLQVFCAGGWLPTVYFTSRAGDDLIVCLGGDGTVSEVCAGMMRAERKRPIGYIPLGTANDVARTLHLSNKPIEAAKQILAGKPLPFDIGRFGTDDFFTYVAAFGAFTEVSYATPQDRKRSVIWRICLRACAGSARSCRTVRSSSMTAAPWRTISSSAR